MQIRDCLTFSDGPSTFLCTHQKGPLKSIKAFPLKFKPHSDGIYAVLQEFFFSAECSKDPLGSDGKRFQ